jgi:hypothetical protein
MRQTLILYQYPDALPDVYRWAADQRVQLVHNSNNNRSMETKKDDEYIYLEAIGDFCMTKTVPYYTDKLVIWGQVNLDELKIIQDRLTILD